MKLTAKLTAGWDYKNSSGAPADELHESALNSSDYIQFLSSQLTEKNIDNIYQLEKLFRKSVKGSQPIKKLVGALTTLTVNRSLTCYIDVFAYSFLRGAKNFDLLLPLDKKQDEEFITTYQKWSSQIRDLENFERFGESIKEELKEQYLALRKIASRASVRDEIRTLASLLISGTSTLEEVSEDMGLNYILGQTTVDIFENIAIVTRSESKYAIAKEAIPVVIFCLRETIGLDLLSNLDI